jgi:ATP-dependent DNA ligase
MLPSETRLLLAWRAGDRIRLFTRNGNDWSSRYPLVLLRK